MGWMLPCQTKAAKSGVRQHLCSVRSQPFLFGSGRSAEALTCSWDAVGEAGRSGSAAGIPSQPGAAKGMEGTAGNGAGRAGKETAWEAGMWFCLKIY